MLPLVNADRFVRWAIKCPFIRQVSTFDPVWLISTCTQRLPGEPGVWKVGEENRLVYGHKLALALVAPLADKPLLANGSQIGALFVPPTWAR